MPIPQQIDEDMPKMQCVILFRELLIDFKKLLKNDQQDVYIYFGIKQNNRTEFSEINLIQKTNVLANINCSIKLELMFHEELTVILYQTNKKTIN